MDGTLDLDALVTPLRNDVLSGAVDVARVATDVVRRASRRIVAETPAELRAGLAAGVRFRRGREGARRGPDLTRRGRPTHGGGRRRRVEAAMKLSETRYDNRETGCCARLDAARWDDQTLHWAAKPFAKGRVRSFLHVPLNFGSAVARLHRPVEAAGAYAEEPLLLSDEASPWGANLYLAVDRDVPGVAAERMSGTYMTRVFEGPYRNAGRWAKEMTEHVAAQGRTARKLYFFYATCPKCAKHFGENQVVLFAQVD